MKFVLIWTLNICQLSYPATQKAPYCAGLNRDRYIPVSQIKEMERLQFIFCRHSEPKGDDNRYSDCQQTSIGCRVTLSGGTIIDSFQSCGAWHKVDL